ncbi:hypothetical protein [Actibacterium sp. 188UL27-1]|uniref:hypothetical protein n=1 Tax=Actibacterium sp. 188UL27-1 TaxID=2786961 RepID=UPI00195DEAD2|nr:hypothetical protein [Actibacterium sp. 188UL27-1]MBM7066375.1 hypothetical protein [Actibacterium sp. 188UL27-1]
MTDLTRSHAGLTDTFAARRYFAKFEAITGHLGRVATVMQGENSLTRTEVDILGRYIRGLSETFKALSMKYLLTGRETGGPLGSLSFDTVESGFPVYQEVLTLANDAQQAGRHLAAVPPIKALKDEMIRQILGDLSVPTKLQFALSQRLYYETLAVDASKDLFWAQNDPVALWQRQVGADRNQFLIHWAVYDSQVNLPTIYLMEVEDVGRLWLTKDQSRWPAAQAHLMAQSLAGLKLVTIARGFDQDFNDLHPKRLRRFHVGPMYSSAFTRQSGPLREVLEEARAPRGQDWALAWTSEELISERVELQPEGWFGHVERQIYALDPFSGKGAETGATRTERAIILPERPYQELAERNPPGFHAVRKFVVHPTGRVLSYR